MPRFWISWHQPPKSYRPRNHPPSPSILGWWLTSKPGGRSAVLYAVVKARSVGLATRCIRENWPRAKLWRLCERKPAGWLPPERFGIKEWMQELLGAQEGGPQG